MPVVAVWYESPALTVAVTGAATIAAACLSQWYVSRRETKAASQVVADRRRGSERDAIRAVQRELSSYVELLCDDIARGDSPFRLTRRLEPTTPVKIALLGTVEGLADEDQRYDVYEFIRRNDARAQAFSEEGRGREAVIALVMEDYAEMQQRLGDRLRALG